MNTIEISREFGKQRSPIEIEKIPSGHVYISGTHRDDLPLEERNTLLVALRTISESLGAQGVIYHGGGGGLMTFISIEAKRLGLTTVGIGSYEYHGRYNIPCSGDIFTLASNILERLNYLNRPPLHIYFSGGPSTYMEAVIGVELVKILAVRERKKVETIPLEEERRAIFTGDTSVRIYQYLDSFGLLNDPYLMKRIYLVQSPEEMQETIHTFLTSLRGTQY